MKKRKVTIMKTETLIYDKLKKVLPKEATSTILFALVTSTSYELFFYSKINGFEKQQQCFKLSEMGVIDDKELDEVFLDISNIIKGIPEYSDDMINVLTYEINSLGVKLLIEHFDKTYSIYKIKKNWKNKYIL